MGTRSSRAKFCRSGRGALLTAIFALSLVAFGLSAGPALAGPGLRITLYNKTTGADVTLIKARGEDCWYTDDLDHPLDQKWAAPGQSIGLYTEKKSAFFSSCYDSSGVRGVDMLVREVGSSQWYLPDGSPTDYRIFFDGSHITKHGFWWKDSLSTWLPRKDGRGLICWHTATYTDGSSNQTSSGYASIYVYSDGHCNTAVRRDVPPTSAPASEEKANTPRPAGDVAKASAAALAAFSSPAVIDVLSSVYVVCPWYVRPGDTALCDGLNVLDDNKWNIDNVTSDVRKFNIVDSIGTSDSRSSVATAQVSIPPTSGEGTLMVNKSVATEESAATATQHGAKVGVKIGFKQTLKTTVPLVGDVGREYSQEISAEYSYSTTTTKTTRKSDTRLVSISAKALPGFTTKLDVFTDKRDANYIYDADLDFGKSATFQPVSTPAPVALEQSPSFRQPCLEYTVGDATVRNSLKFIGQQLLNAGNSPTEPTLSAERRAFMASLPNMSTEQAVCPGFPSGYGSVAKFKGEGVGTYANLGYDERGLPVQVMAGCVYQTPFPPAATSKRLLHSHLQPPTARPLVAGSPCQEVPVNGGVVDNAVPGQLIDARAIPSTQHVVTAPAGSDEILGPSAGGTIYTNNGALDIVHAGHGPTRVIGGSGENVIYGGAGDDTLIGGHGGTNYLHAGAGDDRLQESNGIAIMYGGAGHDTFEGHNMNGVMVGGSGTSRMIGTGDLSRLQMEGGTGENTYILTGAGTPNIVQLPSRADSTVVTDHSLRVPQYVHGAIATGSQPVTLTGSDGTESLIANNGNDTLISGPGPATLHGGRGHDTIVFNPYNDDLASGGRGADRYVFTGIPDEAARNLGVTNPLDRTAATITDFDPAKGDRLVLSTSVFGSQLEQLKRHFNLVTGRFPQPRGPGATLLLDTVTGVLSFDPDGNGPISDKVIVRLPHFKTIKPAWLEIV